MLRYALSPTPSDLTHKVNLNRFETGSGAGSVVQAHAGSYALFWVLLTVVMLMPSVLAQNLPMSSAHRLDFTAKRLYSSYLLFLKEIGGLSITRS